MHALSSVPRRTRLPLVVSLKSPRASTPAPIDFSPLYTEIFQLHADHQEALAPWLVDIPGFGLGIPVADPVLPYVPNDAWCSVARRMEDGNDMYEAWTPDPSSVALGSFEDIDVDEAWESHCAINKEAGLVLDEEKDEAKAEDI